MDAEALLDTRAKDLQALTFRLSPPARPRRVIGWVIDEHLRTDLVPWSRKRKGVSRTCPRHSSLRRYGLCISTAPKRWRCGYPCHRDPFRAGRLF
jgi:hypothetical protein